VVVWRHPGETEDQAIERYMRQHPEIAARTIHVVSWELLEK
jgi:predicted RNA-binding protein with PIN domain